MNYNAYKNDETTPKTKAIVFAILIILLSLALMAAGTYALFTGETTVGNHLKAGTLECSLKRTGLTKYELDETGLLVPDTDSSVVDFTKNPDENLFGFTDGTKIVPCSKYAADLEIINEGDVAFGYYIEIVITEGDESVLLDQLAVSVGTEEVELSGDGTSFMIGSEINFIGRVPVDQSAKFTVTVEFLDLLTNNDAKLTEVEFDLVVHAVQLAPEN